MTASGRNTSGPAKYSFTGVRLLSLTDRTCHLVEGTRPASRGRCSPQGGEGHHAQCTHLRAIESDFDTAQSTLRSHRVADCRAIGNVGPSANEFVADVHSIRHSRVDKPFSRHRPWLVVSRPRSVRSLLHSVFSLGCHLELATDKLLPIRCRAYLLNQDITHALGRFYSVPTVVLFLASVINFLLTFIGLLSSIGMVSALFTPAVWLLVLFTIFHIAFFLFIWCQSRSWATLVEQLPEALRTGHLRSNPNQAPTPNEVT